MQTASTPCDAAAGDPRELPPRRPASRRGGWWRRPGPRRGVTAVVLTRLARSVGVSPAAAYRHFPGSHDELLDAVAEQPGPFGLACLRDHDLVHDDGVAALLNACLDELVSLGRLPADRRPHSEVAAWAAVHGLALLLTTGPLAAVVGAAREAVIGRTLDAVGTGI